MQKPPSYYVNIAISKVPAAIRKSVFSGKRRYCPICENSIRQFRPFGLPPRHEAWCPICGSLERHRLAWLVLGQETDMFDGQPRKMLHVAPEPIIEQRLRRIEGLDYLSLDLSDPRAMMQADLANIPLPEHSFDLFYCSHVLEHIPQDREAMRELFRVLKPGGWGIVQVPVQNEKTVEDPTVVCPKERAMLFGQEDHVRRYGPDVKARLMEAGFQVQSIAPAGLASAKDCVWLGIEDNEALFLCTRPAKD